MKDDHVECPSCPFKYCFFYIKNKHVIYVDPFWQRKRDNIIACMLFWDYDNMEQHVFVVDVYIYGYSYNSCCVYSCKVTYIS